MKNNIKDYSDTKQVIKVDFINGHFLKKDNILGLAEILLAILKVEKQLLNIFQNCFLPLSNLLQCQN